MLKRIDRALTAELLGVLMAMGHGDDIVLCDVNHPAATIAKETSHGQVVHLSGCDLVRATEAILSLMPLDIFVEAPSGGCKVCMRSRSESPPKAAGKSRGYFSISRR